MRKAAMAMVAAMGMAGAAMAQTGDYPNKPIRVIVPVSVGGGVDTAARLLATHLRNELGQPLVVENKPGAGGNIGLDMLAKSPADGYTLAIVPNSFTINHTLMKKLPFDTFKSFAPVAMLVTTPAVVAGRADLPAHTLPELVAYAKANPGKLSYAGCDTGSALHLSGELFKQVTQTQITHVPYKGCADSVPNVLGGQVDLIFISLSNVAAHAKEGRLRLYATASEQRLPFVPDLPTGIEQGLPGFKTEIWFGMLAPAGTPKVVIDKLNQSVNKVLAKPEVMANLATSYQTPAGGSPEKFAQQIRSDVERYGQVIRSANIQME